jgi:hypothetical protein
MKSKHADATGDPFLSELEAMLHDYEGPGHARRRPAPARRWARPLPIVLVLVAACAVAGSVAAIELGGSGGSNPHSGGRQPFMGLEAPAPIALARMIKTADAIFVGQLTGSSKTQIAPGVCPLHLRVERIYRGDIGPTVDLGAECFEDFGTRVMVPSGRIGQSYLIFAVYGHERPFEHILFPLGELDQEALFLVVGPDAAVRDSGTYGRQEVRLDTLDRRLAPSGGKVPPPLELWPTSIAPEGLNGATETVTLDQAIADADTIFVGRVMAIGPGKNVSSDKPGEETIVCPVRYRVERVLRGAPADTIDLGDWFSQSATKGEKFPGYGMFPAEVGKRYLVFAHRTELGTRHVSMLVPEGASQNVYELTDDNTAVNDARTKVNLDELAQRLESTPKSP